MITEELQVGDKVRVKRLAVLGVIVRVSTRMRHSPYLVSTDGYGTHAYGSKDLEKLPPETVLTLVPPGGPVMP